MAMRRPRIKASANLLSSKRKPKAQEQKQTNDAQNSLASEAATVQEIATTQELELNVNNTDSESMETDISKTPVTEATHTVLPTTPAKEDVEADPTNIPKAAQDNSSFKYPPKVEYNRSNSNAISNNADDVFQSDLEENIMQMDLQKTSNGYPMSPTKAQARARIRATPIFGQRRNSFVGTSPSPHAGGEDIASAIDFVVPIIQRRERHYSASQSQNISQPINNIATTPHKFAPSMGVGRIRTESGCSVFSDTYAASSKSRKADDHNQRAQTRRDFETRFINGVPDKSTLKMFDLIYYNPATNPMELKPNIAIKQEKNDADDVKLKSEILKTEKTETSDSSNTAMPVPQLKLNSNGELILDDKSLEIETTAEQEARKVLANSSLIYLDENTGMNGFYKRQKRTREWPPEETIKFYRCLQTVGTDFSLMCPLFPKRTRRDLKLKFKKEERSNGALINKALWYPKTFNIDELKQQLESEERERDEIVRKWKEIKAKEAKDIKKVQVNTSIAARMLKNGDDLYRNENVTKRKFSKRAVKHKPTANNSEHTQQADGEINDETTALENPTKRRRKRRQPEQEPQQQQAPQHFVGDTTYILPDDIRAHLRIKTENIKAEHAHTATNESFVNAQHEDATALENELTELLQNTTDLEPADTNKTLTNLDDGSTITLANEKATKPAVESLSINADSELEAIDIQQILSELADGSLVLVSTLDPENDDKVVNEIFMLDKITGELCEKPLDIPDAIVQSILAVMSE